MPILIYISPFVHDRTIKNKPKRFEQFWTNSWEKIIRHLEQSSFRTKMQKPVWILFIIIGKKLSEISLVDVSEGFKNSLEISIY